MQLDSVEQRCIVNVCQPGSNLLAAGYCMYSSSVIFVLTVGTGVYVFTLDPMYGEFVLTQEKVQIPKAGKIYAFNEGNYALWDDKLKLYMDSLKEPGDSGKPYSARYIGSLVGDFHRTLLYGGIYGYPRDKKSKNGKLRLLYECAPMSFIVEQAGGKGSDGHQRILDITPTEVSNYLILSVELCPADRLTSLRRADPPKSASVHWERGGSGQGGEIPGLNVPASCQSSLIRWTPQDIKFREGICTLSFPPQISLLRLIFR